jgi:hypothetical protein
MPDAHILRTFASLFMCLRQHGTFFVVLGDFLRGAQKNHQEQEEFA